MTPDSLPYPVFAVEGGGGDQGATAKPSGWSSSTEPVPVSALTGDHPSRGPAGPYYAVIRDKHYGTPVGDAEPGYVMLVERETAASLFGMILKGDGSVGDWSNAFDVQPTYSSTGWGRDRQRVRDKPGRIVKERFLTKHATFDEAKHALERARTAWFAAEDEQAHRLAKDAYVSAVNEFHAIEGKLRAQMIEELAPYQVAKSEAVVRLNKTRMEIIARQTAAAIAAAQAIEARRAETRSGSVHESAVVEDDAPKGF